MTRKEVFEYISHSAEIALQEIGLFTGNLAIQAFAVSPAIIYKIVSGLNQNGMVESELEELLEETGNRIQSRLLDESKEKAIFFKYINIGFQKTKNISSIKDLIREIQNDLERGKILNGVSLTPKDIQKIKEAFIDEFFAGLIKYPTLLDSIILNTQLEQRRQLEDHEKRINKIETCYKTDTLTSETIGISREFVSLICKCNSSLIKAQKRIRVYSWDELDFTDIYVVPELKEVEKYHTKQMEEIYEKLKYHKDKIIKGSDEDCINVSKMLGIPQEYVFEFRSIERIHEDLETVKLRTQDDFWHSFLKIDPLFDFWNPNRFKDMKGEEKQEKWTNLLPIFEREKQEKTTNFFPIFEREKLIRGIFEDDDIIYVIGEAGSGKSLFLKYLCIQSETLVGFKNTPRLIIRGEIKRLIRIDGTYKPMVKFLEECFVNGSLMGENDLPPEFLRKCLMEGRCLVLLDALDEVAEDQRNELHDLIISCFKDTYPKNKICITSRERGFIPDENITSFYIQPITEYDVNEYVDNFIKINKFDSNKKERFIQQAKKLIDEDFIKGFLTLSMLMAIYKNEEEIPTNKFFLYEKCFEYIAASREKSKQLLHTSSIGEEYNWNFLAKLMSEETFMELAHLGTPNNNDIPETAIKSKMLELHKEHFDSKFECKMAIEVFLEYCSKRTEIFVTSSYSNTYYRFFHRSFYDYFYVQYIEKDTKTVDETLEKLKDFDLNSEIFELFITIYQQKNPSYLQALITRLFEYIDEQIKKRKIITYYIDILTIIIQFVEDSEFIQRYIKLFLLNGDIISELPLKVDFKSISSIFVRDLIFLKKRIDEYKSFISKNIIKILIKFILRRRKECIYLAENWSVSAGTLNTDIRLQKGFSTPWLLTLFPDYDKYMDQYFKKFENRKFLLTIEKMNYKELDNIMMFVKKVNNHPSWLRKIIYDCILLKAKYPY